MQEDGAGPPAELAVRARRLLTPEGERAGAVLVRDGRIAAVVEPGAIPSGTPLEELDDALVLMPGLVELGHGLENREAIPDCQPTV